MKKDTPNTGIHLCEIEFVDEARVKNVQSALKSQELIAALAEIFKVLGDPTRLKIAHALSQEELCVCDIANLFNVSQSAVSHSLRVLRQLKLVKFRREGKIARYSLDDEHIESLIGEGFRHIEELF